MNIPRLMAAEGAEDGSHLGRLRVHLCRLSNVRHTYYITKSCQRHGQKIIVNFKLNNSSIMVITKTINKRGGELMILSNTACCQLCQTSIGTKAEESLLNSCSFEESITRMCHCVC